MEGKCVLFKSFGGVDAFPLCIKTHDVDEFVNTVYLLSGSFGGINAEYIIPKAFDKRVGLAVAKAVADAARHSGVARI